MIGNETAEQQHARLTETATLPRWKTQTKLHDPANGVEGNCTQAVFASILGLELDEVPDFNTIHQHAEHSGYYYDHLERWCREKGFQLTMLRADNVFGGYYLADGPSPRGASHFVVMKSGSIHHDPHPSRAGILMVKHIWILLPPDPSLMTYDGGLPSVMDF